MLHRKDNKELWNVGGVLYLPSIIPPPNPSASNACRRAGRQRSPQVGDDAVATTLNYRIARDGTLIVVS